MFKKTQLKKQKSFKGSQGWEASFNALIDELFGDNDYPNDGVQFEPIPVGTGFNWAGEFDWDSINNGDIVADAVGITDLSNLYVMPVDKNGNDITAELDDMNSGNSTTMVIIRGDGVIVYQGTASVINSDFTTETGDYEIATTETFSFASVPSVVTIDHIPPNGTPSPQKSITTGYYAAGQGGLGLAYAKPISEINLQNINTNYTRIDIIVEDVWSTVGENYQVVMVFHHPNDWSYTFEFPTFTRFAEAGTNQKIALSGLLTPWPLGEFSHYELFVRGAGLPANGLVSGSQVITFSDSGLRQNVE